MLKAFAVAFVIVGGCAVAGAAPASGADRDGVRKAERIDRHSARSHSTHRHSMRSAERAVRAPRRDADEAWTGTRVDAAGNSYLYFRTGAGTPFGPGGVLR